MSFLPKFGTGQLLATPAALAAIEESGQQPLDFLELHARGEWGQICLDDCKVNELALQTGARLLSAYVTLRGVRLWIITEAADDLGRRPATTIILPEEY
jgi:hypothetical protein